MLRSIRPGMAGVIRVTDHFWKFLDSHITYLCAFPVLVSVLQFDSRDMFASARYRPSNRRLWESQKIQTITRRTVKSSWCLGNFFTTRISPVCVFFAFASARYALLFGIRSRQRAMTQTLVSNSTAAAVNSQSRVMRTRTAVFVRAHAAW